MSLAQIVASYLSSWEGHTALQPESYIRVMNMLDSASIEEINTEMNALTQQQLWNESLIDVFHDELLDRIGTDTTFAISTSWMGIEQWIQSPFVIAYLGFEESYLLSDDKGELIRVDNNTISSYTLTNASFQDPVAKRLIHLFIDGEVDAILNVSINGIQIASIMSRTNPTERVEFQARSEQSMKVPVKIRETPDFNVVKRMYLSLKTSNHAIIDIYSDRLINQLIDYDEMQDIHNDNGDTFEGSLFLTGVD